MTLACNKRAERSARKQAAEHRVRLCEENLHALRKDELDAVRDLQEIERKFEVLRQFFLSIPVPPPSQYETRSTTSISGDDSSSMSSKDFS